MAVLRLDAVKKSYGHMPVIHGVDLEISSGEFVVFVGPSGCGKSTLLRIIAGLESITSGAVLIDDQVVNLVEPAERGVAMVFQSYALYPHMTVYKNMAFGLTIAGFDKAEIKERITNAAKSLQIEELLQRLPKDLSGGQRQRVAIGRSIVRDPRLFLFDEPLSNLDAALRVQMRVEIAKLHKMVDATMIYVTHDQVEAMTLADRIVVLNAGRIEQVGSPLELYRHPANIFVAGFIGSPKMNFLTLEATPAGNQLIVRQAGEGTHPLPISGSPAAATLGIRPENLVITEASNSYFAADLQLEEHLGEHRLLHALMTDGTEIVAKLPDEEPFPSGTRLHFTFDPAAMHLFDVNGRKILTSPQGNT